MDCTYASTCERREGCEGSGNDAQDGGNDGRGNGYGADKPMAHRASCHGAPTTPPDPAAPAAHMCEAPTGACLVARRGEMNGGAARQQGWGRHLPAVLPPAALSGLAAA